MMIRILAFASVASAAALILPTTRAVDFVSGASLVLFGSAAFGILFAAIAIAALIVSIGAREAYGALKTREAAIVSAIATLAAVAAGSIAFGVYPAAAAETAAPAASAIVIPWGDWLGQLLIALGSVFVALLTRAVALAPEVVRTFVTNDVIAKAVDYAIATTRDAARGQTVSIQVSNKLIAAALAWIVENEPKTAKASTDKLRPLIVARLSALGQIPAEATASTLAVSAPAPAA